MKISYFETGRYPVGPETPKEWPVRTSACDPVEVSTALRGMADRARFVEKLGFDWVSLSEHHYSPRILTPSPAVSAAWLVGQTESIKIALLGPIVPTGNPIRVAEEFTMLEALAPGRIVCGLLRGTTNEYLSYDLTPGESRARTDEAMELIVKAWTEPQPFGWQGRYFQYRTVSIWPCKQPDGPQTYILGTSAEVGDFAARHRMGMGVSYGTFEGMARSTSYYRKRCEEFGWTPGPDDIVYRANMILRKSDDEADEALRNRAGTPPFPVSPRLKDGLIATDTTRNVAGTKQQAFVGGVLPISFCGGPDRIVEQIRQAREVIGAGVLDISLTDPGTTGTEFMMENLEFFGRAVLPRIKEI